MQIWLRGIDYTLKIQVKLRRFDQRLFLWNVKDLLALYFSGGWTLSIHSFLVRVYIVTATLAQNWVVNMGNQYTFCISNELSCVLTG
jgi:hypothetical protein